MALPGPVCPGLVQGSKLQRARSPLQTLRETMPAQKSCWNKQERKEILLFLFNRWETKAQRVEEACQKSDRKLKTARNRIQVC